MKKVSSQTWPFPTPDAIGSEGHEDSELQIRENAAILKAALKNVENKISSFQKQILVKHYESPNMTCSVWQLAKLAGFKGRGSRFSDYEQLVRTLFDEINRDRKFGEYDFLDTGLSSIAKGLKHWDKSKGRYIWEHDDKGRKLWKLKPEVARALEELGWVQTVVNIFPHSHLPIPLGSETPKQHTSNVSQLDRDLAVRNWVYESAAGICECCKLEAPFRRSDGSPYLEVHHVRHLSNEGKDKVTNCVALCPNCHRELHYGERKDELVRLLDASINRLIPEL